MSAVKILLMQAMIKIIEAINELNFILPYSVEIVPM